MKRRGGYSLIELVLVMLLLIIVAVSVFLLTSAGSSAYARLSGNRSTSSDLRIALSYIDVRIKKLDGVGRVTVSPAPFGGGEALRLTQTIEGRDYETYLYVDQGSLKELIIEKGRAVTPDMAGDLAKVEQMRIHLETDDLLSVTLATKRLSADPDSTGNAEATQWIYLRSGGLGGETR